MKRLFALFIIIPLLSACCFISERAEAVLIFPDTLQSRTISSWRVIYPDSISDGIVSYAELFFDGSRAERGISLARGVNLPVLAYPVFGRGGGESYPGGFPAGAFFPLDLGGDGTLRLSWEGGAAAEILRCCSLNSPVYRGFDAGRLRMVMTDKAAEGSDGDIWMIDPESILCRLGYGIFRESAVQLSETMEFRIPVQPGASFVSDNPFRGSLVSAEDGALRLTVPINKKSAFFSEDALISVYFNNSYWCWSDSSTGAGESGRR